MKIIFKIIFFFYFKYYLNNLIKLDQSNQSFYQKKILSFHFFIICVNVLITCSIENHKGKIFKIYRQILYKKIFYKIQIQGKKKRKIL